MLIYEYKIDTKCMNLQALLLLFLLQTCYYYYYKIVTIAITEKSKKKSDITKTQPRTSITQRSRTNLGRSVEVTTYVNIKKDAKCMNLQSKFLLLIHSV